MLACLAPYYTQLLSCLPISGEMYLQHDIRRPDLRIIKRRRCHVLEQVLKEGHNVLLLDEPTNDLDVETLRSLEEAIHGFAGSVLIVSHDRWFLDRVCSHTIAFEDRGDDGGGESKVVVFDGNYGEYARQANRGGARLE